MNLIRSAGDTDLSWPIYRQDVLCSILKLDVCALQLLCAEAVVPTQIASTGRASLYTPFRTSIPFLTDSMFALPSGTFWGQVYVGYVTSTNQLRGATCLQPKFSCVIADQLRILPMNACTRAVKLDLCQSPTVC